MTFLNIVKTKSGFFVLIAIFVIVLLQGQKPTAHDADTFKQDVFKIMFYNVENLFDIYNDPEKRDDEYLPDGARYWSQTRYQQKLNSIYKVIVALGGWQIPAIIGLCEIENERVLKDLVTNTPLSKYSYKFVHQNSPDRRGIDVALLYREDMFLVLKEQFIKVTFPSDSSSATRDILYVKGTTNSHDTLHVFVNHWPSRWGGQFASEPRRFAAAMVLRNALDSLLKVHINPNVIITGDFNDEPHNISITGYLKASCDFNRIYPDSIYNLMMPLAKSTHIGTHKFEGNWAILDQFIVTGNLLQNTNSIYTCIECVGIFDADFLLERDERYLGIKPFRTYVGYKYNGGYSDHLPVWLDLYLKNEY